MNDRSGKSSGAAFWNGAAQDRISALLDEVDDENQDDDATLDLAAIRQALADKEAAETDATATPDPVTDVPTPDDTKADEEDADDEPTTKRRGWLAKVLGDKEPDIPDPKAEHDADAAVDIVPPAATNGQASAPEASEAEAPVEPPGAETRPKSSEADTPPTTEQSAAMRKLVKDSVVMKLIQQGVVALPQALEAVRLHEQRPGDSLWRFVASRPGVDRTRVFEVAADQLGFDTVDVVAQNVSGGFVRNILHLLSPALKEQLFVANLLPFKLKVDAEAQQHSLLIATHDPSHARVHRFVEMLGMPAEVFYAPEADVRAYLDRLGIEDDAGPEETLSQPPEPSSSTASSDAGTQADASPESLGGSQDDAFLELQWEPFDDGDARGETDDVTPDDAAEQAWKLLADFDKEEPELHDTGSEQPGPASFPMDDQVIVQDSADGGESKDEESRNDNPDDADAASFDGSAVDVPEPMPAPDTRDEPEAPTSPGQPPSAEASARPIPAEDDRYDDLPDVDLEKVKSKDRVVAMLLRKGVVEPREVKLAYAKQKQDKIKDSLWRVLTIIDDVPRDMIFAVAAGVYAFKTADIEGGPPDPEFARSVMDTFEEDLRDALMKLRVVPFEVDLDQQTGAIKVIFITHDPTRPEVHRTMQKLKLERFELRYAPERVVTGLILEAFPRRNEYLERISNDNALDLGAAYQDEDEGLIDEDALEAEISRSKLINLFEATLVEAVRLGASDVHIWPNAEKHVEIHFRIDGRLQRWHLEDKVHPEALLAVIKDNAMNVDRFERDAAQDGFIQRWVDEALIRFRVSVLPIANAATDVKSESIVIRVLDDRKVIKDLRKLGLNETAYNRFMKAIRQPHGMVILTGPTGSGKTTTLYASIHEVISPEVNVLTVEDPVEYILPGVRQIKLNNKLGLEGALRSILRHDPDIVMVGEMRDKDTAELAIKLANTGHLTFSTLHTNDAASAVTRLYKMDIEPFLIAYAINLVVAQRLIRRLCTQCKQVDPDPDPVLLKNLGFSEEEINSLTFYIEGHDDNCPRCKGLGYKGRRAVTEAMYFSREIRHLIADSEGNLDEQAIKDIAMKQGMLTLQDSAREIVKTGDTSVLEMLRVVSTED